MHSHPWHCRNNALETPKGVTFGRGHTTGKTSKQNLLAYRPMLELCVYSHRREDKLSWAWFVAAVRGFSSVLIPAKRRDDLCGGGGALRGMTVMNVESVGKKFGETEHLEVWILSRFHL